MRKDKKIPQDIIELKGDDKRFVGWRKSRFSAGGSDCVEVGIGSGEYSGFIGVRDSKNSDAAVLAFTSKEWAAFVRAAKEGAFDIQHLA